MSVFDKLDEIRLSDDGLAPFSVTEVLTRLPVRKPDRTEFIRVNAEPSMSFATAVYVDKAEQETYLVAAALQAHLMEETKPVVLTLTTSWQGSVFLWPVPIPSTSGGSNMWWETARAAAEVAKTDWVRVKSNKQRGAYQIEKAEGELPEPDWPDKLLPELLKLAFADRVIDSADHPVMRRLRGLV